MRNDTRRSTSTNGTINARPGIAYALHAPKPEQDTLFILLDDPDRHGQRDHGDRGEGDDDSDEGAHPGSFD